MYVSSLNDLVYLYIKLFIIYFLFLFIESSQKQMKLCIIPNNQKTNFFSSFIFVVVCKIWFFLYVLHGSNFLGFYMIQIAMCFTYFLIIMCSNF